jgi:hypothetical protein
MLTYLSGIGATRPATRQAKKVAKQAQKTAVVKAKIERKAIQQKARQQRLTSAGTFAATSAKKVAQKTPAALVVQRIKKAKVEGQKRAAFKKAGEPLAVSPSEIFAEPQEIQNADIEFEQGEQEIDEPEFESNLDQDDMGIIYPGFAGPKKSVNKTGSKKTVKQKASLNPEAQKKTQLNPEAKAKKNEAIQKLKTQVLSVAKATLEAKGIKFPSKDQIQKQAEEIAPPEKKSYTMPLIIGGGALALLLILKKK